MSEARGRKHAARRALGLALALVGFVAQGWFYYDATAFPTDAPIEVVDEALLDRLRAEPGLHLALALEHRIVASVVLEDDALNRRVYGTSVDRREPLRRYGSIHIQQKGERAAIHADRFNPAAGFVPWLLHGTLDVPALPSLLLTLVGLRLFLARRAGRGGAGMT